MSSVVIAGTGLFTPAHSIANHELVESFNTFVRRFNERYRGEISAGQRQPLAESSAEFIEKASGIRSRYVLDKEGILDPERLKPDLEHRVMISRRTWLTLGRRRLRTHWPCPGYHHRISIW